LSERCCGSSFATFGTGSSIRSVYIDPEAPDTRQAELANFLQNPIGMFDDGRATLNCSVRCPGGRDGKQSSINNSSLCHNGFELEIAATNRRGLRRRFRPAMI
jgi:hypothetical protein